MGVPSLPKNNLGPSLPKSTDPLAQDRGLGPPLPSTAVSPPPVEISQAIDLDIGKEISASPLFHSVLTPDPRMLGHLSQTEEDHAPKSQAQLLAQNFEKQNGELQDLELELKKISTAPKESQKEMMSFVEGLGFQFLQWASLASPDDKDNATTQEKLKRLAANTYQLLARVADSSAVEEIKIKAAYYEGLGKLALEDIDGARFEFEKIRDQVPDAEEKLNVLAKNEIRKRNLAALGTWSNFVTEGEVVESEQARSTLGNLLWTADHLIRRDGRSMDDDRAIRVANEKKLISQVQDLILSGEYETINEALGHLSSSAEEPKIKSRAWELYQAAQPGGKRFTDSSDLIPRLIEFTATEDADPNLAQALYEKADRLENENIEYGVGQAALGVYAILHSSIEDSQLKKLTSYQLEKANLEKGFKDYLISFLKTTDPEALAVDVTLMAGAAFVGGEVGLAALDKLRKAGTVGWKGIVAAKAAETGAEGTALWAINTSKDALLHDPAKILNAEHLAKSFGSTLIMIGFLKGLGEVGPTYAPRLARWFGLTQKASPELSAAGKMLSWATGHAIGMGAMVASTQTSEALNLQESPLGGWKESLVHDIFGYVRFALAHQLVDGAVGGKLSKFSHQGIHEKAFRTAQMKVEGELPKLGYPVTSRDSNGDPIFKNPAAQKLCEQLTFATLTRPGFSAAKLATLMRRGPVEKAREYARTYHLEISLHNRRLVQLGEYHPPVLSRETAATTFLGRRMLAPLAGINAGLATLLTSALGWSAVKQGQMTGESNSVLNFLATMGMGMSILAMAAAKKSAIPMPPVKEKRPSGIHPKDSDLNALGEKAHVGNIEAQRSIQQRVYDKDPEAIPYVIAQAREGWAWAIDCLTRGAVVDRNLQGVYLEVLQNYAFEARDPNKAQRAGYFIYERFASERESQGEHFRVINWDPEGKKLWVTSEESGAIHPIIGYGLDHERQPAFQPGERLILVKTILGTGAAGEKAVAGESHRGPTAEPVDRSEVKTVPPPPEPSPQELPEGKYWKVARIETSSEGELRFYAVPKTKGKASRADFGEGDFLLICRKFPNLARTLDIREEKDGSVSYPDLIGLNRRLEEGEFGFRFYDPQEEDYKPGTGELKEEVYLEHIAKAIPEFPLAGKGKYHFHDLSFHLLGLTAMPPELLARAQQGARFWLNFQREEIFQKASDEIKNLIASPGRSLVEHFDTLAAALSIRLGRQYAIKGMGLTAEAGQLCLPALPSHQLALIEEMEGKLQALNRPEALPILTRLGEIKNELKNFLSTHTPTEAEYLLDPTHKEIFKLTILKLWKKAQATATHKAVPIDQTEAEYRRLKGDSAARFAAWNTEALQSKTKALTAKGRWAEALPLLFELDRRNELNSIQSLEEIGRRLHNLRKELEENLGKRDKTSQQLTFRTRNKIEVLQGLLSELGLSEPEVPPLTLNFLIGEGQAPGVVVPSERPTWRVREISPDRKTLVLENIEDPSITTTATALMEHALKEGDGVETAGPGGGRALAGLSASATPSTILGKYYEATREIREDGSVWITARPKVDGSGLANEGDLVWIAKNLPTLAEKLAITVNPNGSVTYPDYDGLNQRLEAQGFGFRIWEPKEEELKGGERESEAGQATFLKTLEHLAKDPPEFPLAREGSEHFHDMGIHLLGYLAIPPEVLQQISQTARTLLEWSHSPEFQEEGPARDVLHRAIETFIDGGIDLQTGLLANSIKKIEGYAPHPDSSDGMHASLLLLSERSDLARIFTELAGWLREESEEYSSDPSLETAMNHVEQFLESHTPIPIEILSRKNFSHLLQQIQNQIGSFSPEPTSSDPYHRCITQTETAVDLMKRGMTKEGYSLLLQTAKEAKLEIKNLNQLFMAQLHLAINMAEAEQMDGANGVLRDAAETANQIKDPKKRKQVQAQILAAVKSFGLSDPNQGPWQSVLPRKGVLLSNKGRLSLGATPPRPKFRTLLDKIGNDAVRITAFAQALLDRYFAGLMELTPAQLGQADMVVHLDPEDTLPPNLTFLDCIDDYIFDVREENAPASGPVYEMAFHAPSRDGKLPPDEGRKRYFDVTYVEPGTGEMVLSDSQGKTMTVVGAIPGVSHPFQVEPGEQVVLIYPFEGRAGTRPLGHPIPLQWRNEHGETVPVRLGRDLFPKHDPNFLKYGPQISTDHAKLEWSSEGILLSDVGSSNGTFIYENRTWRQLEPGKRGWGKSGKPGKPVLLQFDETGRSQLFRLADGCFVLNKNDWQLYAIPSPAESIPSPVPPAPDQASWFRPPLRNLARLSPREIEAMARQQGLAPLFKSVHYDLLEVVRQLRAYRPDPGDTDARLYFREMLRSMSGRYGIDVGALREMDEGKREVLEPLPEKPDKDFSQFQIGLPISLDVGGVRFSIKTMGLEQNVSKGLKVEIQSSRFDPNHPNHILLELHVSTGFVVGPPETQAPNLAPVSRMTLSLPTAEVVASLGIPIQEDGTLDKNNPMRTIPYLQITQQVPLEGEGKSGLEPPTPATPPKEKVRGTPPRGIAAVSAEPATTGPVLRDSEGRELHREARPDGSFLLDGYLLIRQRQDGTWTLIDTRDPGPIRIGEQKQKMAERRRGQVALHLTPEQIKIYHKGNFIEPGEEVVLQPGEELITPLRLLRFQVLASTNFDQEFFRLAPDQQQRVLQAIYGAKNLGELIIALKKMEGLPSHAEVAEAIESCLRGEKTSDQLPQPLRPKVLELMGEDAKASKAKLPQGLSLTMARYSRFANAPPQERAYHAIQTAISLPTRIREAASVDEIRRILSSSHLHVESLLQDLEAWAEGRKSQREVRNDFGLRDRLEKFPTPPSAIDPRAVAALDKLDRLKEEITDQILKKTGRKGKVKAKAGMSISVESLEDNLHNFFERTEPLAHLTRAEGIRDLAYRYMDQVIAESKQLYGADWNRAQAGHRNYFTGESLGREEILGDRDKQFRFARMLLYSKAGRPIIGEPTLKDEHTLVNFVEKFFEAPGAKDYESAQEEIRYHFTHLTPKLRDALKWLQVRPGEARESKVFKKETMALMIEAFFGKSQHRQIDDPHTALRLACLIGKTGYYREVGVTHDFSAVPPATYLSLGDLGSVSAENRQHLFSIHTHPEEHENPKGEILGMRFGTQEIQATYAHGYGEQSRDTRNVLFSSQDVRLYITQAKVLFRETQSNPNFDPSLVFDKRERVYRNWVQHPHGLSEITVHLDPQGRPIKAHVRYGVYPGQGNLDRSHEASAAKIEQKLPKDPQVGIPIFVDRVDPAEIEAQMPWAK